MFVAKKPSKWTWNTSSGKSESVAIVSGSVSNMVLNSPNGGTASFNYITVGVGLSVGLPAGLSGSTEDMTSAGKIFISDDYPGSELNGSDFEGFCVYMDASAAAKHGVSVGALLVGIPGEKMPESMLKDLGVGMALTVGGTMSRSLIENHPWLTLAAGVSPYFVTVAGEGLAKNHGAALPDYLRSNAKAAVFIYGESIGVQAGIGFSGGVGYIWSGDPAEPPIIIENHKRVPVDRYERVVATTREKIPFPADVLFDFDKSDLKPDAELALWLLARKIQQKLPDSICIEGHTDGLGKDDYNLKLSKRRADAVGRWLITRAILKSSQVTTIGLGHKFPAFPDKIFGKDNPTGRMRNRRIEVRFLWN